MRHVFRASLALAAVLCAACSDSTAPPISLTDEEIGLLFSEMGTAAGGVVPVANIRADTAPLPMASATTTTTSSTVECVRGGKVTVSGTASETPTGGTIDATESFNNCGSAHFTIDGSLRLHAVFSQPNDSSSSLQATIKGTLNVTHVDGRTGSCRVDVTLAASSTGSSDSFSATGTVCGRAASTVVTTTG